MAEAARARFLREVESSISGAPDDTASHVGVRSQARAPPTAARLRNPLRQVLSRASPPSPRERITRSSASPRQGRQDRAAAACSRRSLDIGVDAPTGSALRMALSSPRFGCGLDPFRWSRSTIRRSARSEACGAPRRNYAMVIDALGSRRAWRSYSTGLLVKNPRYGGDSCGVP